MKRQVIAQLESAQREGCPADFINERELLRRVPVSRRTLFAWRESGKVPFVNLGGRRIIFHWPSVEAALLRQQRGPALNTSPIQGAP